MLYLGILQNLFNVSSKKLSHLFLAASFGLCFFCRRLNIHAQASRRRALAAVAPYVSPAALPIEVSWFCPVSSARNRTPPRFFTYRRLESLFKTTVDRLTLRQATATRSRRWLHPCHPPAPTKSRGSAWQHELDHADQESISFICHEICIKMQVGID